MIDDKEYRQVLIIGDEVIERDYEKLKKQFDTSHKVGDWEVKKLLEGQPELIVVGAGQDGVLEVEDNLLKCGVKIIADITPKALDIYNKEIKAGKKVNALIHTTC